MSVNGIARGAYGLFGTLYVLIGVGSMLLPAGWLPGNLGAEFFPPEMHTEHGAHVLQEFGTVYIGLGLLMLWYAARRERNAAFHWLVTFHLALMALVHVVGAHGLTQPWSRWLVNSIPFVIWLILGVLQHCRTGGKATA